MANAAKYLRRKRESCTGDLRMYAVDIWKRDKVVKQYLVGDRDQMLKLICSPLLGSNHLYEVIQVNSLAKFMVDVDLALAPLTEMALARGCELFGEHIMERVQWWFENVQENQFARMRTLTASTVRQHVSRLVGRDSPRHVLDASAVRPRQGPHEGTHGRNGKYSCHLHSEYVFPNFRFDGSAVAHALNASVNLDLLDK